MTQNQTRSVVTCPECRRSMRIWAHDARRTENRDVRDMCIRTSVAFRDGPCHHAEYQKQHRVVFAPTTGIFPRNGGSL